ncbi:hypothetical protein ACFYUV_44675 [Nonomuraea sp. NPDC003560]|uniref:hypothetical protein n=1 Tax=Nonomuraea sp. NPDC003560 TaxID=3364341 RepID=UPI00369014D2
MPIDYTFVELKELGLPRPLNADVAAAAVKYRGLASATVAFPDGRLTDEERHALTWLLASYAPADSEPQTNHQIMPLTATTVGQVILAYGKGRHATATLVGRGLPAGAEPPSRDLDQLRQSLTTTYELAGITGVWTVDHLVKLHEALRLVPAADRSALRGVEIERVREFEGAGGHNKAKFVYERGPWSGSLGTLKITDAIFRDDAIGFYGGASARACSPSVRDILHEVGHVVESAACRTASRSNAAWAVQSVGGRGYGPLERVPKDAVTEAVQLRTDNDALNELGPTLSGAEAKAQYNALLDAIEKVQAWITASDEKGVYPQENALAQLKSDVTTKLTQETWKTYRDEIVRWCDAQILEVRWRAKFKTPQGNDITPCLRNFVVFVNEEKVGQDLTPYALTSAGELFAETYAFWIVDPDAVGRHHQKLRAYFDDFRYRRAD